MERVIYTGFIDACFNYSLGSLEYHLIWFEIKILDTLNLQGNSVMNYTDRENPWTWIIEYKCFEMVFPIDYEKSRNEHGDKTVISHEYCDKWKLSDEPYYLVNDDRNTALYDRYKAVAENEGKVIFGNRLGEYKYYNMIRVIMAALEKVEILK